jgi:hypothetical protein
VGNGDLLVAYSWPDVGVEGWLVRNGAPAKELGYEDREPAMYDAETWLGCARGQSPRFIHVERLARIESQTF